MKYKLVIFDLDGTILNTIEDLWCACNYALNQFHLPLISLEDTKRYLGHGIRNLVLQASNYNEQIEDILSAFHSYYRQHYNDHTVPYEGIYPVLKYCIQQGGKVGVYTNKAEDIARPLVLEHFKEFEFIYGDVPSRKRKPDPTFLTELIQKCSCLKEEVLYIGDSEVDIALWENAHIDGICVSYGFRKKEELCKLTNRIVDNPLDIILYLE